MGICYEYLCTAWPPLTVERENALRKKLNLKDKYWCDIERIGSVHISGLYKVTTEKSHWSVHDEIADVLAVFDDVVEYSDNGLGSDNVTLDLYRYVHRHNPSRLVYTGVEPSKEQLEIREKLRYEE